MSEYKVDENLDVKEDEYRCAVCHKVFKKGWPDEEALKEKEDIFPGVNVEDCDIVRGTDDNSGMLCVYNKHIRKIEMLDPPMTPPRIIQGEYIQVNIQLKDGDAVLMIDKVHYYAKTVNILKKMGYKGEKV